MIWIELLAIAPIFVNLAVRLAQNRSGTVLFSRPNHDILQNIVFLHRPDKFVHDSGAKARGKESHSDDQSLWFEQLPDLTDDRQFHDININWRCEHPQTGLHTDGMFANLDE